MKSNDIWDIIGFLSGILLLFTITHGYIDGYGHYYPLTYTFLFIISVTIFAIACKMVNRKSKNNTYE
jgi:hypothetical protein